MKNIARIETELKQGFHYFIIGWGLILKKGLRKFIIIPFIINIFLLASIFWLFIHEFNQYISFVIQQLPNWLSWLHYIILILLGILFLTLFYFIFNVLAGFIAAPFNGILSEKVEQMLTGEPSQEQSIWLLIKDIPRILRRECKKLVYSLPKIVLLFLLSFIPIIGHSIIPILIFIFSAWLISIQYCDYPFDNHKIPFEEMRQQLTENKIIHLSFGMLITICSFIPIINFLIIPVAVIGATAMWVDLYKNKN